MTASNTRKERSRAYPVMSLEEGLSRIESINTNLGINGQFNRESLAIGMGYTSLNGASARRVAALVHYGFLTRDKDQYSLSPLAKQYLLPTNDNDKDAAVRTAALSPTLFAEIYDAFKGQVIPKQFANRLIQEFGIQQKVAADVERIFRSTVSTAGILQGNGILSTDSTIVPSDKSDVPRGSSANQTPDGVQRQQQLGTPDDYLTFRLPSGLIVSYSQELASAFAFGVFGSELKALDEAVAGYTTPKASDNDTDEEAAM